MIQSSSLVLLSHPWWKFLHDYYSTIVKNIQSPFHGIYPGTVRLECITVLNSTFVVVKSVICKNFIAKVVIYIHTSNRQLSLKSRSDKWSCSSTVILKYPQRVYWSWTLLNMRLWQVLLETQNINIWGTIALWKM